jgi:hypothetical protein
MHGMENIKLYSDLSIDHNKNKQKEHLIVLNIIRFLSGHTFYSRLNHFSSQEGKKRRQ